MSSIKKKKPLPHVVFMDTSTLWYGDKHFVADPRVDTFWDKYSTPFSFEMVIPDVVRGELLFQQTTSAVKSLRRANQAIDEVSHISHRSYSHRVTESRIRTEIEKKFDKWAVAKHAQIIQTPADTIKWPTIVQQAIWRQPPFSNDPKDSENEKGFRDALILETIAHHVSQETRQAQFAFVCKDQLLRETTEERLKTNTRFTAYELIEDFQTYLDLTKEKLEDRFIRAIVRRASVKFYSKGNPDCLYFRDGIRNHLMAEYTQYFDNPEKSEQQGRGLLRPTLLTGLRTGNWEPLDNGKFWVARSQYQKRQEGNVYMWQNEINYVRQYIDKGLSQNQEAEERLLILTFTVQWKSKVTSDGRFMSYELVEDTLSSNTFRSITGDDLVRWYL